MRIPDIKTNRIACCIVASILCLTLFVSTWYTTNNYQNSPIIEKINTSSKEGVTIIEAIDKQPKKKLQASPKYTYDTNWKPKSYPPPSKEVLKAIMSNTIQEGKATKIGPLTNEKSTSAGRKNILLTAIVNSGMMDYTFNWIQSLKNTNQDDKFLVFAIDQGVVDEMTANGYGKQVVLIPEDWYHVPLASDFALWKSNDYRPITHAKTLIVERLLYLDITVWFTDVDMVFLNSHILETMLIQIAERPNTHMIFSQEVDQRTINSGFYMMQPSKITKQFMAKVIELQDKPDNTLTQQKIMNSVLKAMFPREVHKSPYRFLDMLLFPNGKYYFRMNLPKKLGLKPMMVHANYLVGDKKKAALIKAGLWYQK